MQGKQQVNTPATWPKARGFSTLPTGIPYPTNATYVVRILL